MNIEKTVFSPEKILNEVIDSLRPHATALGVSLAYDVGSSLPSQLNLDPTKFRQLLMSFLESAISQSSPGVLHISTSTKSFSNSEALLVIEIKAPSKGTHSKSLELEIRTSPLEKNPTSPRPVKIRSERLQGIRILGVDDSPDNRLLLRSFLKRESAEFDEADSGETALLKISCNEFDIILMDIQMPGIDGYETVRILRQQGYKKPIIALTAHAMADERRRILASGFDGHVAKPIDSHLLVEMILKMKK